jgi:glycosyltransferase involved in cell wall biosynthesis
MNILFISNDQNIFDEKSAVRARMRTYATEVAKNGGTLHILSRAPRTAEVTDGSLVLHGIAGNPISVLRRLPHIARKLIRAHSIAVVSAQDPFERGWVAYKAVHHTSAKLHIQIHTDFCSPWFVRGSFIPTIVNRIRRKLADRVLPHADGIRVVSKRIQDSLTSRYGTGLKNIAIIPIPVDATVPDLVPFPHADGFMLFTASRLEQEKRIQDLL